MNVYRIMIENMIEGIKILQEYDVGPLKSTYEEVWFSGNPKVSDLDKSKLENLSWYFSEGIWTMQYA